MKNRRHSLEHPKNVVHLPAFASGKRRYGSRGEGVRSAVANGNGAAIGRQFPQPRRHAVLGIRDNKGSVPPPSSLTDRHIVCDTLRVHVGFSPSSPARVARV